MAEACAVAKASRAEVDAAQIQAIYDGLPSGIRSCDAERPFAPGGSSDW